MFSSVVSTVGLFTTGSHSLLCGSSAKRWETRLAGPRLVLENWFEHV